MPLEKQDVKNWLKKIGKDRIWLGLQCGGASKRTVDNWLAPTGSFPPKAVLIIQKLMQENETAPHSGFSPQEPIEIDAKLVINMTPKNFRRLEQIALSEGITLTEAATKVLGNYVAEEWTKREQISEYRNLSIEKSRQTKTSPGSAGGPYSPKDGSDASDHIQNAG